MTLTDVQIKFRNSGGWGLPPSFPTVFIGIDVTDLVVGTSVSDKQLQVEVWTIQQIVERVQSCFVVAIEWERERDISLRATELFGRATFIRGEDKNA